MPERPAFRRRLLVRLGAALVAALAFVGLAAWLGLASWTTHAARGSLREEVREVAEASLGPAGLDPDRYHWDEPHHRFEASRIDPVFVQVFGADGRRLRASENVARFPDGGFPGKALRDTESDGPLTPLSTFRASGRTLYHVTEPVRDAAGRTVGWVQASRSVPALPARLGEVALGLGLGLGLLGGGLLALVWAVGRRVVAPIEALTRSAAALSADTLGERVAIPADADREAAALAQALNDARTRLDAAFAEMQRFTANAAHELQTPLTVLRGTVDVALRREREPEAYRETLRTLGREVDAMVATVRGLLALARLDAGAPLDTAPVDLGGLVREEAERQRPDAEARGLALTVRTEETWVDGHAPLLREVARNLIDNAIKYTDRGGIAVEVTSSRNEVRLVVADTGRGLPDGSPGDRFWRAPDVQHLAGSGLGLAIVGRITERHGGQLALAPGAEGGTRVDVTFPRR